KKFEILMANAGIVRNRLKIQATLNNAKIILQITKEWKSLHNYIWHFVNEKPIQNKWKTIKDIPSSSLIAETLSKDLKKRGGKFIGEKVCYAFMQAVGMVNDHTVDCFRHKEVMNNSRSKK